MRRRLAAASVLTVALTALTACGSDSGSDWASRASRASSSDSIDGVTITGDFAKEPTVKVDNLSVKEPESAVLIDGDGTEVAADDSVAVRILFAKGTDGSTIQSNYNENAPETSPISSLPQSVQDAVVGQHIGSRVAIAMPVKELVCGPDAASDCTGDAPQLSLKGTDAVVMVIDLIDKAKAPLSGPEGEKVKPPSTAPLVEEDGDDVTGLDFSGLPKEQPQDFRRILLVKGEGDVVKEDDPITVNYYGSVWGEDKPFDESYSKAPASFTLTKGALIDGWVKGLAGVKVGSRVMLVIPPELGYGKEGSPPSIPGNSTLVFVVDVLGAGG
jgi:peptidylprolyl isomerase